MMVHLFPADTYAISVTTCVWLGVLIVAFFNLRFGWTLSGLVVPGFLVPLLLAKPISVAVIAAEAVVTYVSVYLLSERLNRASFWSSFFGRDRFLMLVIASVLVRTFDEVALLPWLGPRLNDWLHIQVDFRNDLHSYGLIVVSLIANYFWKPGIRRGSIELATVLGLTYLVVRFVLLRYTNFNLGDLHTMYDDVSTSILASPKAYIVILTSCFVASWLNLKYSWDYNGILVPALLALLWHDPFKIVISVCEAAYIYFAAALVLQLPVFRKTTMEGGRRMVLFFTVCFLHRLLLCHALAWWAPDVQATDFFGFGYLLSTLMAIKAHQKKMTVKLVRAVFQASAMGRCSGQCFRVRIDVAPRGGMVASFRADSRRALSVTGCRRRAGGLSRS